VLQVEHLALTPDVGRRVRALAAALEEAESHHAVEASAQVGRPGPLGRAQHRSQSPASPVNPLRMNSCCPSVRYPTAGGITAMQACNRKVYPVQSQLFHPFPPGHCDRIY
jgi:hypothetical protein